MNTLQQVNQAMNLLYRGDILNAEKLSLDLLIKSPNVPQVYYLACEVAISSGKIDLALDHINKAIEIDPLEPALKFKKAEVEILTRQGICAQLTMSELASFNPDDPSIQLEAARIHSQCDNHLGAEIYLTNAQRIGINTPSFQLDFAKNQFYLGKTKHAEELIFNYLGAEVSAKGYAFHLLSQLKKQKNKSNHVSQLNDFIDKDIKPQEQVYTYFALAKELEDIENFKQSFVTLTNGARKQRSILNYNIESELKSLSEMIGVINQDSFKAILPSDSLESPIFIVGMPRTGTTLVERIIGKHQGVLSAGETYDFPLALSSTINQFIDQHQSRTFTSIGAALEIGYNELSQKYLTNMRGMIGSAERYLDKLPFNYLYCGLIKKAFPNARIIHLVRNPMDTCYAIFKTLFNQSYFFSYDLDELADYYIAYRKLMDHWHSLMPNEILDVHYEELVSNPELISKQITDYCDLHWSEELVKVESSNLSSSTASAAQVRMPIYTSSVQKWRNYTVELEPLRQKLLAAGMLDEAK